MLALLRRLTLAACLFAPAALAQAPTYDFAALAEKLKDSTPATVAELKAKLIEKDVCGYVAPPQPEQICAIAIYVFDYSDDEKAPQVVINPVVSLFLGRAANSSGSMIPRQSFALAREVIARIGDFLGPVSFETLMRRRVATVVDIEGRPEGFYDFVGVVGRGENTRQGIGIPAEYFNLSTYKRD